MLQIAPRKLAGLGRFLFMCGDFDPDRMPDTTIGFEDLHDRLSRLPCHKLILLDACHSGEARTSGGDTDANPIRILTRHGIGCVILAACGPDEEAIENDAIDLIGDWVHYGNASGWRQGDASKHALIEEMLAPHLAGTG